MKKSRAGSWNWTGLSRDKDLARDTFLLINVDNQVMLASVGTYVGKKVG